MTVVVCFTNFGPYHLARLRALAAKLAESRDRLVAYEVAGREQRYPWSRSRADEPFEWVTFFPDRVMETVDGDSCRRAIVTALDRDQPDAVGIVGYVRPESMAALKWAHRRDRPAILLSESQAIDRPVVWWKEIVKKRRVRLFDAALVGGPRHRDYLARLGMPRAQVALGYNAVDNDFFATSARVWRETPESRSGLPQAPFFLTVCRFVPEKNLVRLIDAFARYRERSRSAESWDLVLCGDGPHARAIERAIARSGCAPAIHRPGFLHADRLPRFYAHAAAFVLPSLSEPWGLVVNEAAASGLPLVVADRAGCAPTLVPDPPGTTGWRFDPLDVEMLTEVLLRMAALPERDRAAMGGRAAQTVAPWGPGRFASGFVTALELAERRRSLAAGAPAARPLDLAAL
jgi:glycosyltransferase involved in cell wall biosynthesis